MLTEAQKALRRAGIGSSDIAAIIDQDPHRAPIDVWLDKLGLVEDRPTVAQKCGDKLEEAVAQMYAEEVGVELLHLKETRAHREHSWALATPDRFIVRGSADILEVKNVGGHYAHAWKDGLPIDKMLQVQWQAEVLDVRRIDLAALIGGTDFRIFHVERDPEIGIGLLELGWDFWEHHVLARVPPAHDGEAAKRLAALRWPRSCGAILPVTPEAEALRERLLRVKRHAKRVEALHASLEARAQELIGDTDGVAGCFTWKLGASGVTRWKDVATQAGATQAQIDACTGKPGRMFLVKESKKARRA